MDNQKGIIRAETVEDTKKYPEYLQAIADFFTLDPREGDIITHEWLDEHLELDEKALGYKKYQMLKMARLSEFRRELLLKYQLDLQNMRGRGYYVVPVKDQTEMALLDAREKYQRATRDALGRCLNIRTSELTEAEIEANKYAIEVLTGLGSHVSKSLETKSRKILPVIEH